jgi:hypothetical protein
MNIHPRVSCGNVAQQVAQAYLLERYPTCNITSTAVPGSKDPDIIAVVDNVRIQCEVKSGFKFTSPVVTINKTVKRGNINIVDNLVPVMTDNAWNSVEESVDYHRLTDSTIGFPGDNGTPNSGKLPKCLKITDKKLLANVWLAVRNNFHMRQDTYFILVCKRPTLSTHVFYTGYGENILAAPLLPLLSMAKLRTYGTARKDSMRVALKVSFSI